MLDSKRLLDRFLRYIACDSESGDEERFCRLIMGELEALGLTVTRDNAGEMCASNGWNVYASLPGEGEPILFCAHMDTVKPGKNIKPIIGEDGIIRSSGDTILGADDKCGISAVLEALTIIREDCPTALLKFCSPSVRRPACTAPATPITAVCTASRLWCSTAAGWIICSTRPLPISCSTSEWRARVPTQAWPPSRVSMP